MSSASLLWRRPAHYELGKRSNKNIVKLTWVVLLALIISGGVGLWIQHSSLSAGASALETRVPQAPKPQASGAVLPAVSDRDEDLQSLISTWAANHPKAEWSVDVERLDTNQQALYRAEQQYDPASIYKLYSYYALAQKTPFSQWSAIKTFSGEGGHTLRECADSMIRASDNDCGEAVGNQVGWSYTDYVDKKAGFTQTILNRQKGGYSTTEDTALFLKKLEQGTLLHGDERDQLLASMKGQKYRSGIPAGCSGCETFNKTGDRDGYLHDAAIIHNDGHDYVLVIFSKGGSYKEIADLTRQVNKFIVTP